MAFFEAPAKWDSYALRRHQLKRPELLPRRGLGRHQGRGRSLDSTFWYVNEYVPTTSSIGWRLRIGAFNLGSATPTPTPTATATATATPTATPTPGPITLRGQGKKIGGINTSRLKWRGATSANVDVYRDGVVIATTPNDGLYDDSTGTTGQASFTYKVCEAGTQTCSNNVTVNFGP